MNVKSPLDSLVGRKITRIRWNDDFLLFDTDQGMVGYRVDGDCCSRSYFYDFYGVAHLLNNPIVKSTKEIDLPEHDEEYSNYQCYGFEMVTEHPKWGDVTSVFSFRNESNGYYGGWVEEINPEIIPVMNLKNVETDQIGE